jgi:transcriptional regulator with XRE-family HTH domain
VIQSLSQTFRIPVSVFSRRLKEARLRAGLSQEKLGVLAGIDEFSASARINQYERGKHAPDFQMAEHLARVLDIPAPYFYASDDELAEWILAFKDRQTTGARVS